MIVAIDGSTDGTIEMLSEYKKNAPFLLKWFDTGETERYGLGKARNMGIKKAKGDVVVILDDDSFPVHDFVREHKKSAKPKTLTGGYRNATDPDDKLHAKMKSYLKKYGDNKPQKLRDFVVENNCCMYKADWLRSGLFSEEDKGYGYVGQEFIYRLITQGFYYQFNPRAMIYHHIEYEGISGLSREEKSAQNELNKKYIEQMFNKKPGLLKRLLSKL